MELSRESANLIFTYNASLAGPGDITTEFTETLNLRNVIGTSYDKHEFFEITLNNYTSSIFLDNIVNAGVALPTTTACMLGISGLPFVSNSYRGNASNLAFFAPYFLVAGNATTLNASFRSNNFFFPGTKRIKFRKPNSPDVTLNLGCYSVRNTSGPVLVRNSANPVSISEVFSFTIYPLQEEKNSNI
jgi:hypothetical protein